MKRDCQMRFKSNGTWSEWYGPDEHDLSFLKDNIIDAVEIRETMTVAEAKKAFPDLKLD